MKTIHAILALVFASLLITAFSFAGEPEIEVKKQIKIKIADGDDLVDVEADDLEVGETRQSFTESGKEVLLTRTEEGYELSIDGRQIDLGLSHGEGHHAIYRMHGGEDAKFVIRTKGDEESHAYSFVHSDEDVHWVQKDEDGGDMDILIESFSPADHLLESGVLDDLDEETRQKILDTLREAGPHGRRMVKKVIVDVEEKVHEEHDDQD